MTSWTRQSLARIRRNPERDVWSVCRVAPRPSRVAPPHIVLAVLILAAPALLPAVAYASPPDPAWIPGIYDDADYDDVVVQLASGTGDVASMPTVSARPALRPAEGVPPLVEPDVPGRAASAPHSRAPPSRHPLRSTIS